MKGFQCTSFVGLLCDDVAGALDDNVFKITLAGQRTMLEPEV